MRETEAKIADRPQQAGEALGRRQSAITVLKEQADHLRHEAHALESLAFQLEHMIMTSEAEDILWKLVVNARRY